MNKVKRLIMRAISDLEENPEDVDQAIFLLEDALIDMRREMKNPRATENKKKKRKVTRSKKMKLLDSMTKKKWDKYKKGRGRKTYVQIRAEVSRSQLFKKKSKRL